MTMYTKIDICDEDHVVDRKRFPLSHITIVDAELLKKQFTWKELKNIHLNRKYIAIVEEDVYDFLRGKK